MSVEEPNPAENPASDRRVPATKETLNKLRDQIGQNAKCYLDEWGSNEVTRDIAVRVGEMLVKSMRRQAAAGHVHMGLGDYRTFRRWVKFAKSRRRHEQRKDAFRGLTDVPEKVKESGEHVVRFTHRRDRHGEQMETGWEDASLDAQTTEIVLDDPEGYRRLATMLLPRILTVLRHRQGHSGLSADQVEAVWVLLNAETNDIEIPEDVLSLTSTFQTGLRDWRADLARARKARAEGLPLPDATAPGYVPIPVSQSSITHDINRARRLIWTCLYLFVTLAPFSSAVYDMTQMGRLLDCVFEPGRGLSTSHRLLLQKAGSCLKVSDSAYRVDTVATYSATQSLKQFKACSEVEIVDKLHIAEECYATQVPGQDRLHPRFDCVKRCAVHTFESMLP